MIQLEKNKKIYTAIAAPGAGKTEALLSKVPALVTAGKRVVLALPTLILSDEIAKRAISKGITCHPIDHRSGELVVSHLEEALSNKTIHFITCTHESIRRVRPESLKNWILVVDELPKVVDYPDWTLNSVELKRVLEYTYESDGKLWIRPGMEDLVASQVNTHRGEAKGLDCSTLGRSAAHIFRLLLSRVQVFIDPLMPNNGKRHVRAVEEFSDWWKIIASASECHVLAASTKDSEFEVFANIHDFQFTVSDFTPEWRPDSSTVTVYPLLPKGQKFSWRLMTTPHGEKRLIDTVLSNVLIHADSNPLLFANNWAGFKSIPNVIYVPKDCRGLNSYTHTTAAVVLFGGNPSPSDGLGLESLAAKYGIDFEEAFVTTRLLEPTLQAVTRTAIRCRDNEKNIKLYVQDYRVVEYLQSTYFPNAKIDWSLSETMPTKRDGRQIDENIEREIVRLISLDVTNSQIHRQTGVSRQKIQKLKKSYLAA